MSPSSSSDASRPTSGEGGFLDWLLRSATDAERRASPLGDDGAVLRWGGEEDLVVVADAVCAGRHFPVATDPESVGEKALAVNLSDLAAMGATPLACLATMCLPTGFSSDLPRRVTEGLRRMGAAHDCPLVGGDTTAHEGGLDVSVTALGRIPRGRALERTAGRPGDHLFLSGPVGGSLASGRHLRVVPRLDAGRFLAGLGGRIAAIDLSDGLFLDLHRLADASGTGFRLDGDAVPLHPDAGDPGGGESTRREAFAAGEDFELLVAVGPELVPRIRAAPEPIVFHPIGRLTESGRAVTFGGRSRVAPREGYLHG